MNKLLILVLMLTFSSAFSAEANSKLISYYKAASYLQVIFDNTLKNTKLDPKFCGLKQEDLSIYLQMLKAKIDQSFATLSKEELKKIALTKDPKCATGCYCEFYIDAAEKIQLESPAKELIKKQKNNHCYDITKKFCQTKLFKELTADVTSNK